MATILQEWLTKTLQKPIIWDSRSFGDMMKDGSVIAGVLLNYHVIDIMEYETIPPSNLPDNIKRNWKYLSKWLRRLDIYLDAAELEELIKGRGPYILPLFYQLFLHFDEENRTDFIKEERKAVTRLFEKVGAGFKVEEIKKEDSVFDNLGKSILTENTFKEWKTNTGNRMKVRYDLMRQQCSKILKRKEENAGLEARLSKPLKLTAKEKKAMTQFTSQYPLKQYTYEQLLSLEKNTFGQNSPVSSSIWNSNYMDNLQSKMQNKVPTHIMSCKIRQNVASSEFNLSFTEEESQTEKNMVTKVLKLSYYEKELCTEVMKTKQQARNLNKNRLQVAKDFDKQRDQEFNQYLNHVKEQVQLEDKLDSNKQKRELLHKKLNQEKIHRRRQHYYEICYETMLAIVDYVTKYASLKKQIGQDVPDHFINEWKALYLTQQPVFECLDTANLSEEKNDGAADALEEDIVRLELDRQDAWNDEEFKEYHSYSNPWSLEFLIPNYDENSSERQYEHLGINILGHVVFSLLEIKYPYPPSLSHADLPKYKATAILRGISDRVVTEAIQIILNSRKIHVVRLETAINFCLRQYKEDLIGSADVELSFDKFLGVAQQDEDKELIKLLKYDDEISYKIKDMLLASMYGIIPVNSKLIQTPKTIPEDQIILSEGAELGKYVYDILSAGESLNANILSAIIIAYLKNQKDIEGFVLINYPNTYNEAQILEEAFLGITPPLENELKDADDLQESIKNYHKKEHDPFKTMRVSSILNNPHRIDDHNPFESYFTCYINLKLTEDIQEEFAIWNITLENSDFIDRFYAALGVNYSLYYEFFNKEVIVQICKYILGDFLMLRKSAESIFGENVLSLVDFLFSQDDKKSKAKSIKADSNDGKFKDKVRTTFKISKTSIATDIQVIKEASVEIFQDTPFDLYVEVASLQSEEKPPILPGEVDWEYSVTPISETIATALATGWELAENKYIDDISQLLFAKRLQINCLIPFSTFIKSKMKEIITLPSPKQDLVCNFQNEYNNFDSNLRASDSWKTAWHCQVKILQNRLFNICDERKIFAMKHKHEFISDNWVMEELTNMANTYISCMQTELNRFMTTYQILHDFYSSILWQEPADVRLVPTILYKINRDREDMPRKNKEDEAYIQLRAAFQEFQQKTDYIDHTNNPFNLVISNNVELALRIFKEANEDYKSLVEEERNKIADTKTCTIKNNETNSVDILSDEESFQQNALKCCKEWTTALNGEMSRAKHRLLALEYKCYQDMKMFYDHISKTFIEIESFMKTYYLNEVRAVERLCKYLHIAVEKGGNMTEEIVLEHDTFTIDPEFLLTNPTTSSANTSYLLEPSIDLDFEICQLSDLRSQFMTIAPTGHISQQSFIYVLQNLILIGKESAERPFLPLVWQKVDPEQVPKLVFLMFGDGASIDWRDFLIYCLNIRFPTVYELLSVRRELRCKDLNSTELISRDQFLEVKLWYEKESQYSIDRRNMMHYFLFELFETKVNFMNYSAFLLAFCKHFDPVQGFVAALSMAVGKETCYILAECQEAVCKMVKEKQSNDARLAYNNKCVEIYLDMLLNNVIEYCEGFYVTELAYTREPEERKVKKGRSPAKKLETSQSARIPKRPKSASDSKYKLTQSMSNVKVLASAPSEVEDMDKQETETQVIEKEDVKEPESEIEINPNIAYVVSQSVIWNVLRICLPWQFISLQEGKMTPEAEQVTELLKRLEADTNNGDIYVCKLVSDPAMCILLNKLKKFSYLNLKKEIQKVLIT